MMKRSQKFQRFIFVPLFLEFDCSVDSRENSYQVCEFISFTATPGAQEFLDCVLACGTLHVKRFNNGVHVYTDRIFVGDSREDFPEVFLSFVFGDFRRFIHTVSSV
jgi:hypothetical protein